LSSFHGERREKKRGGGRRDGIACSLGNSAWLKILEVKGGREWRCNLPTRGRKGGRVADC